MTPETNEREDFRDAKGWLDHKRFGYNTGDEVMVNISEMPTHPIWVEGKISCMLASKGGSPLYEDEIDMSVEYYWKGKKQLKFGVYRWMLKPIKEHQEEEEAAKPQDEQLNLF